MILGIDEVGRGSVAGPLSVGFCLLDAGLPLNCYHCSQEQWEGFFKDYIEVLKIVRDSKQVREKSREEIVDKFEKKFDHIVISSSPQLIDKYGIGVVLSHILWLGVLFYKQKYPDLRVLADGKIKIIRSQNKLLLNLILLENKLQFDLTKYFELDLFDSQQLVLKDEYWAFSMDIERVVKGDDRFLCIALASIFAKVYRDNLMKKLSQEFLEYGWEVNKGYATKKHLQAIVNNPDNIHLRRSFLKKYI